MANGHLNWIANFIWGIADECSARCLCAREVPRRHSAHDGHPPRWTPCSSRPREAVLGMKEPGRGKDANQHAALRQAASQAFYNTSQFTLRDLKARASKQQLKADFEAYLDGFSPNVQEILDKFKFRNQIPTLVDADILGSLIEKFLDHDDQSQPEAGL